MQLEAHGSGRPDPATFSAADIELAESLDSLDGADNYAGWIFGMMEPFLGPDVLEVGAGHGTFTQVLAERGRTVVATDLSERCIGVLQRRFSRVSNVKIVHGDTSMSADLGPFDTAILINVLEHIEDDNAALRHLWKSLKPGGRLVLWVPAFQALYSEFDRKIGHFRRYRLSKLRSQLTNTGFTVAEIHYANAVGAVAWWLVARVLRRTPTRPSSLRVFDRYAVPVVRTLESRVRPPFGQSIFAVGVRPDGTSVTSSATAKPAHSDVAHSEYPGVQLR
jgi:SAM-dependent methyltransferase